MIRPLTLPDTDQISLAEFESEVSFQGHGRVSNPTPGALVAIPLRHEAWSQKSKPQVSTHTIRQSAQYFKLPENIQAINESRRVVGKKEFEEHQRLLDLVPSDRQPPAAQASPPSKGNPAVDKLSRQLENIFQTLNVPEIDRMTTNHDMQADIVAWVSRLGDLSEQLHVSPSVFGKQERSAMVGEVSKLLVTLNRLIEISEGGIRGVFYDASGSRIDQVFANLRSLSIFCEKGIEEFEDEREDWNDNS